MRLDKWIWAVRMVKNRTLATNFCKSGKVKVNGISAKPAKNLKLGDIVEISRENHIQKYRVVGFLEKRASFEIAQKNFEDISPVREKSEVVANETLNLKIRKQKDGRGSKKDARDRQKMKHFWEVDDDLPGFLQGG